MSRRATISLLLLVTAATFFYATPASADCRWEWDCSRGYPCRQIQVCESTLDLPAIRPPGISPIPSPGIAPIPMPVVPPLGTTDCRQVRMCDSYNQCRWETVCR